MNQKEIKIGDIVRYIGKDHKEMPKFYPEIGTIGTVVEEVGDADWYIQWTKGSTSRKDCWYCDENDIELVENEDITNEEIWNFLKNKMRKNGLVSKASIINTHIDGYPNNEVEIINAYYESDVINAIATAYRSGYHRAIKGRPFKIDSNKTGHSEPKKEKTGHWVPVDPKNLPKEGTRVRYSRQFNDNVYNTFENRTNMKIGETTVVKYNKFGAFGVKPIHGTREWWCSSSYPDRFDMWVEDDE